MLRIVPVFVLGHRFSGLAAIQAEHKLETHGIYGLIRNPSYLGLLVSTGMGAFITILSGRDFNRRAARTAHSAHLCRGAAIARAFRR
jgi:protein-S-isoprenylcysteine O-methyltransferase Ste14